MPELLVELVSEPLPGWAQRDGAPALAEHLKKGLAEAGLLEPGAPPPVSFATPFRVAAHFADVRAEAPARVEERRGPREGAPESAIAGFLRSAGVESRDALELRAARGGKGGARHWFATLRSPPAPARDLLPGVVAEAMRAVRWQKTMRWEGSGFRWPRALRRCLVLLGGEAVSMESAHGPLPRGLVSGRAESVDAHGEPFAASSFAEWRARLEERGAVLDPEARGAFIEEQYEAAWNQTPAAKLGKEEDAPSGLVERARASRGSLVWAAEAPTPIFAKVPASEELKGLPVSFVSDVIVQDVGASFLTPMGGVITDLFCIAERPPGAAAGERQIESWQDGVGAAAARVARARLADAAFHWRRDREAGIEALLDRTEGIQYHPRLGSVRDRAECLSKLARFVADCIGFDLKKAERAGLLAKADLASSLVNEVPTLEAYVGRELICPSLADGEKDEEAEAVALAVEGHILAPQELKPEEVATYFRSAVPTLPLLVAERADALVGLTGAGERATGSRDPLALRRRALHLALALCHQKCASLPLRDVLEESRRIHGDLLDDGDVVGEVEDLVLRRLEVALREGEGIPYDIARAAIRSPARRREGIVFRMREAAVALNALLGEDDGGSLVAAWGRASGFLTGEGHGDSEARAALARRLDRDALAEGPERRLLEAVDEVDAAMGGEESAEGQIRLLARLRGPMDDFVDGVRVLEGARDEQTNRLALLARFAGVVERVADLGQLEGGARRV